jgi:voltage-gated potassium channel
MATARAQPITHGNSYNIFILVLTLASLLVMVLLLLPLDQDTMDLLRVYDNAICFVFLGDFAMNMVRTKPTRQYFIKERGWLDLLGSIPSIGVFQLGGLLRLARLSRLARITRLLRGNARAMLIKDVLDNRSEYAVFITLMAAGLVLSSASILILQAESRSLDANITTGQDAFWWGLVTITTVGYGDFYPVTGPGRLIATFVMFAGVGIIGALASILASILVPPPKEKAPEAIEAEAAAAAAEANRADQAVLASASASDAVAAELARMREELAELRRAVSADRARDS